MPNMVRVTSLFFAYRIHGKNDEVPSNTAVMIMMIVSVIVLLVSMAMITLII